MMEDDSDSSGSPPPSPLAPLPSRHNRKTGSHFGIYKEEIVPDYIMSEKSQVNLHHSRVVVLTIMAAGVILVICLTLLDFAMTQSKSTPVIHYARYRHDKSTNPSQLDQFKRQNSTQTPPSALRNDSVILISPILEVKEVSNSPNCRKQNCNMTISGKVPQNVYIEVQKNNLRSKRISEAQSKISLNITEPEVIMDEQDDEWITEDDRDLSRDVESLYLHDLQTSEPTSERKNKSSRSMRYLYFKPKKAEAQSHEFSYRLVDSHAQTPRNHRRFSYRAQNRPATHLYSDHVDRNLIPLANAPHFQIPVSAPDFMQGNDYIYRQPSSHDQFKYRSNKISHEGPHDTIIEKGGIFMDDPVPIPYPSLTTQKSPFLLTKRFAQPTSDRRVSFVDFEEYPQLSNYKNLDHVKSVMDIIQYLNTENPFDMTLFPDRTTSATTVSNFRPKTSSRFRQRTRNQVMFKKTDLEAQGGSYRIPPTAQLSYDAANSDPYAAVESNEKGVLYPFEQPLDGFESARESPVTESDYFPFQKPVSDLVSSVPNIPHIPRSEQPVHDPDGEQYESNSTAVRNDDMVVNLNSTSMSEAQSTVPNPLHNSEISPQNTPPLSTEPVIDNPVTKVYNSQVEAPIPNFINPLLKQLQREKNERINNEPPQNSNLGAENIQGDENGDQSAQLKANISLEQQNGTHVLSSNDTNTYELETKSTDEGVLNRTNNNSADVQFVQTNRDSNISGDLTPNSSGPNSPVFSEILPSGPGQNVHSDNRNYFENSHKDSSGGISYKGSVPNNVGPKLSSALNIRPDSVDYPFTNPSSFQIIEHTINKPLHHDVHMKRPFNESQRFNYHPSISGYDIYHDFKPSHPAEINNLVPPSVLNDEYRPPPPRPDIIDSADPYLTPPNLVLDYIPRQPFHFRSSTPPKNLNAHTNAIFYKLGDQNRTRISVKHATRVNYTVVKHPVNGDQYRNKEPINSEYHRSKEQIGGDYYRGKDQSNNDHYRSTFNTAYTEVKNNSNRSSQVQTKTPEDSELMGQGAPVVNLLPPLLDFESPKEMRDHLVPPPPYEKLQPTGGQGPGYLPPRPSNYAARNTASHNSREHTNRDHQPKHLYFNNRRNTGRHTFGNGGAGNWPGPRAKKRNWIRYENVHAVAAPLSAAPRNSTHGEGDSEYEDHGLEDRQNEDTSSKMMIATKDAASSTVASVELGPEGTDDYYD